MSKIIKVDENKYQVEIVCSNTDILQKWAENCNCCAFEKISFMRYLITFPNHEDMKYFAAYAPVNCK